jgi:hypothetical protein
MFQNKFLREIKTHILYSVTIFIFENRTVFEIMWKNVLEPDSSTGDNTAHPHWMLGNQGYIHTNLEYVIINTFPTAGMVT